MLSFDQLSFSGHETFPFRYGWLKKGVDAVLGDPTFFSRPDAYVELGVGRNMVRSIRHWCLATRMLQEEHPSRGREKRLRVTELGKALLDDGGWDPYLESPGSLWLVHWQLVSIPGRAGAWFLGFSLYPYREFTESQLQDHLVRLAEQYMRGTIAASTLKRDTKCFVRTYVPSHAGNIRVLEETLDCPLTGLRIIKEVPDKRERYLFSVGPKPSLPVEIFGYALLEFFQRRKGRLESIPLQECLYGLGSPGQAFKLDEITFVSYVESLQEQTEGTVRIDETAGVSQVYCSAEIQAKELLRSYYERERKG